MQSKRKGKNLRADTEDDAADVPAPAPAPERAELTEPLSNYIELVRHSAVRAALTEAPKTALRLAAAQLIAGSTHWRIAPEPRRPDNETIAKATAKLAADETFRAAQASARKLLGKKAADAETSEDGRLVSYSSYDTGRTVAVYQRLTELDDADVMKLLTVAVAETLAVGTGLIDAVGTDLKVDVLKYWQPDDALFALIRDKEALSAMLEEVAGKQTADSYLTATGAKKKEVIQNALAGKGRPKKEAWQPRWMAFPQGQYTKRPLTQRAKSGA
jgi:ParB family chromosome partitioning protein